MQQNTMAFYRYSSYLSNDKVFREIESAFPSTFNFHQEHHDDDDSYGAHHNQETTNNQSHY